MKHTRFAQESAAQAQAEAQTVCECERCTRNKRLRFIAERLPQEDAAWLLAFLDYVVDLETESEMQQSAQ